MSFRNKVLSTESRSCASPQDGNSPLGPLGLGEGLKARPSLRSGCRYLDWGIYPCLPPCAVGGLVGMGGAASQTDGHSRACWSTPPVHKDLKQGGGASPDRCSAQA